MSNFYDPIHLTDMPTTWVEYVCVKSYFKHPHHAFIASIGDAYKSIIKQPAGLFTNCRPRLREDVKPLLSNVIPTLLELDTGYGYELPLGPEFTESNSVVSITSQWTLEDTNSVINFTREIMTDARLCAEALRAKRSERDDILHLLSMFDDGLDPARITDVCVLAVEIGEEFLDALCTVQRQKRAYAELIITCGIDLRVGGKLFNLTRTHPNHYVYVSKDGNTHIPF